jgi:hypothetical protein
MPRGSNTRSNRPTTLRRGSYSTTSRYANPPSTGSKWRSCEASGRPGCVDVYVTSRFGSKPVIVIVSNCSRPSSRVTSRAVSPTPCQRAQSSRRTYPGQNLGQFAMSVMNAKPRSTGTPKRCAASTRVTSVGVFVLSPRSRLGGWLFRGPVEQERVVGSDERIGGRDGVRVVDGAVLTREGDPARILSHAVL